MLNNNIGDYIIVNTENGKKQAELVSILENKDQGDYLIYKLDNEYYGAKFYFDGKNTILQTDLSEGEKKILYDVFNALEVQ